MFLIFSCQIDQEDGKQMVKGPSTQRRVSDDERNARLWKTKVEHLCLVFKWLHSGESNKLRSGGLSGKKLLLWLMMWQACFMVSFLQVRYTFYSTSGSSEHGTISPSQWRCFFSVYYPGAVLSSGADKDKCCNRKFGQLGLSVDSPTLVFS